MKLPCPVGPATSRDVGVSLLVVCREARGSSNVNGRYAGTGAWPPMSGRVFSCGAAASSLGRFEEELVAP